MGYLKTTINGILQTIPLTGKNSFRSLTKERFETHLRKAIYGHFELTDAVRPSFDLKLIPKEGYRREFFIDRVNNFSVGVLIASISKEKLFNLFFELLDTLELSVDVILVSTHQQNKCPQQKFVREQMDLAVLKSLLFDFEDLLLNDGCTGIAVINADHSKEIQLDEHKLLQIFGNEQQSSLNLLSKYSIQGNQILRFITEAEHIHSTKKQYQDQFQCLKTALGIDDGIPDFIQ